MSTFERALALGALCAAVAFSTVRCGPGPTRCLRYSDCDPGLTCAYGHCVFPPPPASDAAGVEAAASTQDAGPDAPFVTSADSGGALPTDDATADDAPSE